MDDKGKDFENYHARRDLVFWRYLPKAKVIEILFKLSSAPHFNASAIKSFADEVICHNRQYEDRAGSLVAELYGGISKDRDLEAFACRLAQATKDLFLLKNNPALLIAFAEDSTQQPFTRLMAAQELAIRFESIEHTNVWMKVLRELSPQLPKLLRC